MPDLFCATTFSLRTSAIRPVLRSTCPNHLILLVRSTTSKSWMPSFVRRESELTSSFVLTLQIQRIMAWSLRRRRFSVSTFMAQVSAACSITLLTHDESTLPLVRRGRWRLVRRGSNWRNLPHAHLQRVIAASSQPQWSIEILTTYKLGRCWTWAVFSSPEPKAYRWAYSMARHPSSVRPSKFSNDISSEAMHEADSYQISHLASIGATMNTCGFCPNR